MVLYPRRLFILILTFFILFLYVIRYWTLSLDLNSFQFVKFGISANLGELNFFTLSLFISIQFSLYFLVPERVTFFVDNKFVNLVQKAFYLETALLFIAIVLGARSGVNLGGVERLILFFVYSLVPLNLLYFTLLIVRKNNKLNTILFLIPSALMASKSGMIFALLIFISVKILKREQLISLKAFLASFFVLITYPLFIVIAAYKREGRSDFSNFFFSQLESMGESVLNVYTFVITSISRRVSGLDVLMIPQNDDNVVFSVGSISLYLLKGVLTAAFVDGLLGQNSYGIGRMFAIEFLNQDVGLANGFEPTLFGIVYHSVNPIFVGLELYLSCALTIIFFRYKQGSLANLVLCYFVFLYSYVFMTGTIVQLLQVFRFYIALIVIYYFYKRLVWRKSL